MNKQLIFMLSAITLALMISSVSAFDFSIRGNSIERTSDYTLQSSVNIYHADRTSRSSGSLLINYIDADTIYRLNADLDETNMYFVDNKAYGTVTLTGIEWERNPIKKWTVMAKVVDYNVNYVYDLESKTILFSKDNRNITIPVKAVK